MSVRVRQVQLTTFARNLSDVPQELRKELRPKVRKIAGKVQRQVQQNASWSSRIPGAVKTRVSFSQRSPGVSVYVDSKAAPHARPLEFGSSRNRQLRHPVFGNPDVWVSQPTRPFFMQAIDQTGSDAHIEITDAIDRALGSV